MQTLTPLTPSRLTPATEHACSEIALRDSLTQFIRWTLRVTASGECSGDLAIALLDQAWAAQKLLWSLRD